MVDDQIEVIREREIPKMLSSLWIDDSANFEVGGARRKSRFVCERKEDWAPQWKRIWVEVTKGTFAYILSQPRHYAERFHIRIVVIKKECIFPDCSMRGTAFLNQAQQQVTERGLWDLGLPPNVFRYLTNIKH